MYINKLHNNNITYTNYIILTSKTLLHYYFNLHSGHVHDCVFLSSHFLLRKRKVFHYDIVMNDFVIQQSLMNCHHIIVYTYIIMNT